MSIRGKQSGYHCAHTRSNAVTRIICSKRSSDFPRIRQAGDSHRTTPAGTRRNSYQGVETRFMAEDYGA